MKRPPDPRNREAVVRIDVLDGVEVHRTNPLMRWVYRRPNGTRYITTLGSYWRVEPDGDRGWVQRQVATTMSGGIAVR